MRADSIDRAALDLAVWMAHRIGLDAVWQHRPEWGPFRDQIATSARRALGIADDVDLATLEAGEWTELRIRAARLLGANVRDPRPHPEPREGVPGRFVIHGVELREGKQPPPEPGSVFDRSGDGG